MLLAAALFLLQFSTDLAGAKHGDALPAQLAQPVAARLAPGGVRVTVGVNTLTFWFVRQLPASAWSDLEDGSLLGALKIDKDFRDIRGRVVKAGTFTLRYGIQPANGDHLGVSPFREFVLLSPVALDTDPAPRGHDGTVEISKEAIGGSHPAVLSIDPPVTAADPLTVTTTELGHKAIVLEVPTPGGSLRFGLVLIGKIEA